MDKSSLRWMCALTALLCCTIHPFVHAQQAPTSTIVLRGSDTLGAKLIPQWAEAFKKTKHPDASFDITAMGTASAFADLAGKTCRIGMSSRRMRPEESEVLKKTGVQVQEVEVARDQIAIVLNAENTVSALSRQQVEGLFTGDILNWSELGGPDMLVRIATRNSSSSTYLDFKNLAMQGRSYGIHRIIDCDHPAQQVAGEWGGIGYVGFAYVKAKGIKVVPVDGILPGQAGGNPPYPYERPMYLYVSSEATLYEREFLEFIKSPQGKRILVVVGFFPPVIQP